MRGKLKPKIIAIICLLTILITQVFIVNASGDSSTNTIDFIIAVNTAKNNPSISNLQNAVDILSRIENPNEEASIDQRTESIEELIVIIEELSDSEEKTEIIRDFAGVMTEIAEETKTYMDVACGLGLVSMLPQNSFRTELENKLNTLKEQIVDEYRKNGHYDGGSIPESWISDLDSEYYVDPNAGYEDDGYLAGYQPPERDNQKPSTNPNSGYRESYSYIVENGVCYKITTYYKNNQQVGKPVKTKADSFELGFCPFGSEGVPSAGVWDITTPDDYESDDNWEGQSGFYDGYNDNINKITVQYTLDKYELSTFYYDTNIEVSENNTITYGQAKEILTQIAIKSKGEFVEDKDKCLGLLEGIIIVVRNDSSEISINEFAKLFKDTKVEVKAYRTRFGKQTYIQDYVQFKDVRNIAINGKKVELENRILTENLKFMFPIEEFAQQLGAEVISSENKITIKLKDKEIVYEVGKDIVLVNNEVIQLDVSTHRKTNGIVYAQIDIFLKELKATLAWDISEARFIVKF